MRPGDDITLEAFRGRDNQQERMGLEAIRKYEATVFLTNDSQVGEYLRAVDAQVGLALQDEINVPVALSELASMHDVKLEESILIALLTVWTTDEARPFFSTTELAGIIRRVFVNAPPKHKDNVSRYFNQDFYAYYEISTAVGSKIRKYRLSNTGYGMAVSALRKLLKPG